MEFDKSRGYTELNADEIKVGSRVIVADNLAELKRNVNVGSISVTHYIKSVLDENERYRFEIETGEVFGLAYLLNEPPEKHLKWTDLNVGDVVRNKSCNLFFVVTGIDTNIKAGTHIHLAANNKGSGWLTDEELKDWELVTEV